MALSLPR